MRPCRAPRAAGGRPAQQVVADAAASLARPPSLRPVVNATGVIVHTNLGRAPLAEAALQRVVEVARGSRRSSTTSTPAAAAPATIT